MVEVLTSYRIVMLPIRNPFLTRTPKSSIGISLSLPICCRGVMEQVGCAEISHDEDNSHGILVAFSWSFLLPFGRAFRRKTILTRKMIRGREAVLLVWSSQYERFSGYIIP